MGVAIQAGQHVLIFGQREASQGINFRPTGASGLGRRPTSVKRARCMGHVAESFAEASSLRAFRSL